jgi:hypothetical protein
MNVLTIPYGVEHRTGGDWKLLAFSTFVVYGQSGSYVIHWASAKGICTLI